MRLLRLVACAIVLTALPASSAPGVKRFAVLEFEGDKKLVDLMRVLSDQARSGALKALPRDRFSVMTRENQESMLRDNGKKCMGGECEIDILQTIEAEYGITGNVLVVKGTYIVTLKLFASAKEGTLLASETARGKDEEKLLDDVKAVVEQMVRDGMAQVVAPVVARGPEEAAIDKGNAADAAGKLRNGAARGTIKVLSKPSGAKVSIDGEGVGNTPMTAKRDVGTYVVTLESPGYGPVDKQVDVVEGKIALVSETLAQEAAVVRPTQARRALVVGNKNYLDSRLTNAVDDAQAVAAKLRAMGFEVTLVTDADYRKLNQTMTDYVDEVRKGEVSFFYYSGHALQVDGENYLAPVDFHAARFEDVKWNAWALSRFMDAVAARNPQVNVVILEACRANPFKGGHAGLAPMTAANGSLVAFAASPGSVSEDGEPGKHGAFTDAFLRHIDARGQDLEAVFHEVRREVAKRTGNQQVPWTSSSVVDSLYLMGE